MKSVGKDTNRAVYVAGICWGIVMFLFIILAVLLSTALEDEVAEESEKSALVALVNLHDFRNITVFTVSANGEGWEEIPLPINSNTTIPLEITWYGEGGAGVLIMYDDGEDYSRVLRYYVENRSTEIVVLI